MGPKARKKKAGLDQAGLDRPSDEAAGRKAGLCKGGELGSWRGWAFRGPGTGAACPLRELQEGWGSRAASRGEFCIAVAFQQQLFH